MITPKRTAPEPTVVRLPTYLQCLRRLEAAKVATVSSAELADLAGVTAAQFRKDLSYLGIRGRPGVGYDVQQLSASIAGALGLTGMHSILLVGAGRLGAALCAYPGFEQLGFRIAAAFDTDPAKIGQRLGNAEVHPAHELLKINARLGCRIGIVAVPATAAAGVVDEMVRAGIRWILNFAPTRVPAPEGTVVRDVDLTHELEVLSYYMTLACQGEASGQ